MSGWIQTATQQNISMYVVQWESLLFTLLTHLLSNAFLLNNAFPSTQQKILKEST